MRTKTALCPPTNNVRKKYNTYVVRTKIKYKCKYEKKITKKIFVLENHGVSPMNSSTLPNPTTKKVKPNLKPNVKIITPNILITSSDFV